MYYQTYEDLCTKAEVRHKLHDHKLRSAGGRHASGLTLFALALGTFAIGTGEFGSNGILQLFAAALRTSVPTATYAITAYAVGVIIGSPAITIAFARFNRRHLLLALMLLFIAGNLLSSLATNIVLLIAFRLVTGTVQGAYFGAGAVVAGYVYGPGKGGRAFATVMGGLTAATVLGSPLATFISEHADWHAMYIAVAALGAAAFATLFAWVPRTDELAGGSIRREFGSLARGPIWLMAVVAALGISSIFAVYTFIGPFVTDAAHEPAGFVPIGLALFGMGMAAGNFLGGRVADRSESAGIIIGFAGTLVPLVIIGVGGHTLTVLYPCFFCVGALMMFAIPGIQVRLTGFASDAPTLMGALNLAALNLANSLGATGGSITIDMGWGTLSTVWAGFALTTAGLALYIATVTGAWAQTRSQSLQNRPAVSVNSPGAVNRSKT